MISDTSTGDSSQLEDYRHLCALAELGWPVLPLYGMKDRQCTCGQAACKAAGKHPILWGWPDEATTDAGQISRWLDQYPGCNWGVSCKPAGIFVLDVDPRNGGHETLYRLESAHEDLPPTVQATTGRYRIGGGRMRGTHYYFKASPDWQMYSNPYPRLNGQPRDKRNPAGGIDIKHNGYVVVPPSTHHSDVTYTWAEGHTPWEIGVADAPEWLLDLVVKGRDSRGSSTSHRSDERHEPHDVALGDEEWAALREREVETSRYGNAAMNGVLKDLFEAAPGEGRNNALNSAAHRAGQLIAQGHLSHTEADCGLRKAGLMLFTEPGGEEEVDRVLRPVRGAFQAGASSVQRPASEAEATELDPDSPEAFLKKMGYVNWQELWADTTEERWLVPGILCEGRGHVVYGSPGVGKSLFMREISACLAAGKSALGFPARSPVDVLYIDHENSMRGDVKRSLIDNGFGPDDLIKLHYFSFPDMPTLDTPEGGEELERLLDEVKPELVVFDTASRTIVGKENENDTWLNWTKYCGKMLKKRQIAFVRIDHEGKNASAGQRGGSAKKGDIDLEWHLSASKMAGKFVLKNEKSRIPLEADSFEVTRSTEPLRHTVKVEAGPWELALETMGKIWRAKDLLKEFYDREHGGESVGETKSYSGISEQCQKEGITKELVLAARKSLLRDAGELISADLE